MAYCPDGRIANGLVVHFVVLLQEKGVLKLEIYSLITCCACPYRGMEEGKKMEMA